MGTRADFYVGRGAGAEWLGSVAWDGRDGVPADVTAAPDARLFRAAVERFVRARDDGTPVELGWPWPWDDSNLTDAAWAFDAGRVWLCWAGVWSPADEPLPKLPEDWRRPRVEFPDMRARKRVAWDRRSGLVGAQ